MWARSPPGCRWHLSLSAGSGTSLEAGPLRQLPRKALTLAHLGRRGREGMAAKEGGGEGATDRAAAGREQARRRRRQGGPRCRCQCRPTLLMLQWRHLRPGLFHRRGLCAHLSHMSGSLGSAAPAASQGRAAASAQGYSKACAAGGLPQRHGVAAAAAHHHVQDAAQQMQGAACLPCNAASCCGDRQSATPAPPTDPASSSAARLARLLRPAAAPAGPVDICLQRRVRAKGGPLQGGSAAPRAGAGGGRRRLARCHWNCPSTPRPLRRVGRYPWRSTHLASCFPAALAPQALYRHCRNIARCWRCVQPRRVT